MRTDYDDVTNHEHLQAGLVAHLTELAETDDVRKLAHQRPHVSGWPGNISDTMETNEIRHKNHQP